MQQELIKIQKCFLLMSFLSNFVIDTLFCPVLTFFGRKPARTITKLLRCIEKWVTFTSMVWVDFSRTRRVVQLVQSTLLPIVLFCIVPFKSQIASASPTLCRCSCSFLGSARAIRNQGWSLVSMAHLWLGTRDFTSIYGGLLWMIGRWTCGVRIASASTGVDGSNAMPTSQVQWPNRSYRHPKIHSFFAWRKSC